MTKKRIRLIYPENPIGWFSKIFRDMVRDHIASKRLAAAAAGKTIKKSMC